MDIKAIIGIFTIFILVPINGLLLYIFFIRNLQVEKFRYRLFREESDFLARTMWIDNKGGTFGRYFSLPSYYQMLFKFWIPLKKYDRPLSDFYTVNK